MQNILLIEDDQEITKLITLHFDAAQYKVTCCDTGKSALKHISEESFELIILDISLPDMSGLEICKSLRAGDKQTPVIMLTCRGEEADKVLALELGADDYMTKPFGILELMARSKAMIRRSGIKPREECDKLINILDLVIDSGKKKATLGGNRLDLTVKEFELLCLLAGHPGKTFTRQELLQQIWGFAFAGYEHTVTSHINRLRLKIEKDLNHPKYILTSWGSGYRFAE